MTGTQKKYLRGLAHGLKPVVRIGRNGLTDSLLESLDEALESHELVKVKFPRRGTNEARSDFQDQKRELSAEVATRLSTEQVGSIGHVVIFFRQARDPEKRSIRLPG